MHEIEVSNSEKNACPIKQICMEKQKPGMCFLTVVNSFVTLPKKISFYKQGCPKRGVSERRFPLPA